ncbi:MAG: hypothetical protein ACRDGI_03485, partial [Candidatus Limnocylindrales bacterium]
MRGPKRLTALVATVAILAAACGGTTATVAPSAGSLGSQVAQASVPPSAAIPSGPATVPPGGPVTIKWFCCLGTGDDPSQLPVEAKVVSDFNASHPNIHLVFDHAAYLGARDALSTELGSGNGPDI